MRLLAQAQKHLKDEAGGSAATWSADVRLWIFVVSLEKRA